MKILSLNLFKNFNFLSISPLFIFSANAKIDSDVFTGEPPVQTSEDILRVFTNFANWLAAALGIISVAVILWAGFLFMTAGGSDVRLKTAKAWLKWGIIGIVVALFAYVAPFLIKSFLES